MTGLDFIFEITPWEATLETLRPGDSLSAARFLTLLEGEDEDVVEDAFLDLEDRHIRLEISDLPADTGNGSTALRLRREKQLVEQGRLLEDLEQTDPLRLYLEEIEGLPALEDPEPLAQQGAKGDEEARTRLLNASLYRVVSLAQEHTGRGVLLLDLIQEGNLGLWQGILAYDGKGSFAECRDWWISQSMAKLITLQARSGGVGRKLREELEAYRQADQRLLTGLGRNPTLEEIAMEMGITPEEASVVADMLQTARLLEKKDAPAPEESGDAEQAVENTAYFQSRQRIQEMLSVLEESESRLLSLRFGLEGGRPLSPQEAGAMLGLTSEEVLARETDALNKLRQAQ